MANIRNQPHGGVTRQKAYSPTRGGRKQRSAKRGRGRIILLKLCVSLLLAAAAWAGWQQLPPLPPPPWFPITYVRVQGAIENLDLAKFQQTVQPALIGGYFDLDMAGIEGAVRSFAWVDQVQFAKVWPDTLVVTITEHKPVARWGEHALLNSKGMRFTPEGSEALTGIPVIYGQPGMEANLLEVLQEINGKLAAQGVSVASLDLSKRRAWIVKLSNGLEMHFGRQDPLHLMDRFLALLPKLGDNSFARLQTVDLRYPNGFAVVWKPPEETENNNDSGAVPQLNGTTSNLALEKK